MLTKQEFLKAIATLKKQSDLDDNFHTHMSAAFPGSYAPIYEEVLWSLSIRLLEKLMEDPYKYIDWWVWETHFGKDSPNIWWNNPDGTSEKEWNLTTPEALYDFLVENAQRPQPEEESTPPTNQKTLTMEEFMELAEKQLLKR